MNNTQWLTIKEATLECHSLGLPRSSKSLRRWCSKEEVEAQKRKTSTGEKWFIDRVSLEIKVKEELEFLKQSSGQLGIAGQRPDMTEHDRTRPDVSGHDQTQADTSGQRAGQRSGATNVEGLEKLQDEILSLKVDVAVKSEQAKQFQKLFLEGQKTIQAQSRYIGHVETKILRMGGTTDQAFLEAPVPKSGRSEDAVKPTAEPDIIPSHKHHPDQASFYPNRSTG